MSGRNIISQIVRLTLVAVEKEYYATHVKHPFTLRSSTQTELKRPVHRIAASSSSPVARRTQQAAEAEAAREAAVAAAAARARKKSTAPTVRRLRGDSSDNLVKLPKPLTVRKYYSLEMASSFATISRYSVICFTASAKIYS